MAAIYKCYYFASKALPLQCHDQRKVPLYTFIALSTYESCYKFIMILESEDLCLSQCGFDSSYKFDSQQ
jgi:hypothetical protein